MAGEMMEGNVPLVSGALWYVVTTVGDKFMVFT